MSPNVAAARSAAAVAAAHAFLDALSPAQRDAVAFPLGAAVPERLVVFGGPEGRLRFVGERCGDAVWSNFPVSGIPRPGLPLGALDPARRDAVLRLLAVLLSSDGYRTVLDVMGSDQALAECGPPYACGVAHYMVSLFGPPGLAAPWMVQFGGHHLGLNIVLDGPRAVLAPAMTGAQPSRYRRDDGDPTAHVHTVYRDFANDYGRLWRHPPPTDGPVP